MSEPDIAARLRPGDRLIWGTAAAEPLALLGMLDRQLERVPAGCSVLLGLGLGAVPDPGRIAAHMRVTALGGAGTNRAYQELGALDVLPAHYWSLPHMIRRGDIAVDVALVQLAGSAAAPRFALNLDHVLDAVPRARVVVAEVNDQAPETEGDTRVARDDIDVLVPVSHPISEVPSRPAGGVEKAIGGHIARLVPDGATLQVGLGALADAALEALAGKKALGLHSGTIGDRVADLVEAGVITNSRKPIDTGLSVTAGLLGTRRVYAWAHRNPRLRTRSTRYTHDVAVHERLPHLIGINSALEVDLTGQMNAEVAGKRHMGLVGGHADFMRGCFRSEGGRGIVAMESTARGGKLTRIVPRLSGGVVTTSRSDADVVVTEHGIAELRGRSIAERARALIAVAHPDFRRELEAAAETLL